jgi:hypothetical protein
MINNKLLARALALFDYYSNDFPNFDGEIPMDSFFTNFNSITGLSFSSFYRFTLELRLLGLLYREGSNFKINKENIKNFEKKLSTEDKILKQKYYEQIKETNKASEKKVKK